MNKIWFALFITVVFNSCTTNAKEKKPPVLMLKEMGKLATTEYIISKVVKANDNKTWYKLGERKILISCRASIKAGIDLTRIKEEDVKRNEEKISVRLPPPQILSFSLPPENIKVEYTEIGIFRDQFSNAERDDIMRQAEKQIKAQLNHMGILITARENAATFVTHFFSNAGFEEVTVTFQ